MYLLFHLEWLNSILLFIFLFISRQFSGDPERLPKEVVLKRAADLAEALYAMPRGGLGGRSDLSGRSSEGYNYSQLAAIQHDATSYEGVDDYNRGQNSSPR